MSTPDQEHVNVLSEVVIGTQREDTDFTTQPPTRVWTIPFRTPSGVDSSVQVPQSAYSVQNVARLIAEKVQQIEAVQALGKQSPATGATGAGQ